VDVHVATSQKEEEKKDNSNVATRVNHDVVILELV
jgi:hypothetical protein